MYKRKRLGRSASRLTGLRYSSVPRPVLYDPRLTFGAQMAYSIICDHAGTQNRVFLKRADLAKEMQCSRRSVQRYISDLRKLGLVRISNSTSLIILRDVNTVYPDIASRNPLRDIEAAAKYAESQMPAGRRTLRVKGANQGHFSSEKRGDSGVTPQKPREKQGRQDCHPRVTSVTPAGEDVLGEPTGKHASRVCTASEQAPTQMQELNAILITLGVFAKRIGRRIRSKVRRTQQTQTIQSESPRQIFSAGELRHKVAPGQNDTLDTCPDEVGEIGMELRKPPGRVESTVQRPQTARIGGSKRAAEDARKRPQKKKSSSKRYIWHMWEKWKQAMRILTGHAIPMERPVGADFGHLKNIYNYSGKNYDLAVAMMEFVCDNWDDIKAVNFRARGMEVPTLGLVDAIKDQVYFWVKNGGVSKIEAQKERARRFTAADRARDTNYSEGIW